jgi:hypothetical protein
MAFSEARRKSRKREYGKDGMNGTHGKKLAYR